MRFRCFSSRLLSLACCGVLAGCSGSAPGNAHAGQTLAFRGVVHGGQQPVSGATIELYAVGTTGNASAATTVLQQAVTTDSAGNFNFSSDYSCPASNPLVYLTAVGGNPGLATGTNNPQLAMLSALGSCNSLGPNTFIVVNEVTTVGTLAALAPWTGSVTNIGYGNDAAAFGSAFATVAEYVNTANGAAPGPALPSGYYASTTELNTLADIVATCVNSAGGAAGDGTSCGRLFAVSGSSNGVAPVDTVQAVANILKAPTQNVAAVFDLEPSTGAPFQPTLQSAPSDWTLPIVAVPATPTFSEPAGTYTGSQTISLSETTPGAVIYYTLDGSTPTPASNVYSGPIAVSAPEVITTFASNGRASSAVAKADYLVAPGGTPPPETSVTPSSSGTPIGVIAFGTVAYVSVQGTGQIFTYDITTGYPLQVGSPYTVPCNDPSGMVITNINGTNVMAVACYDTGSLVTLAIASDHTLSALGTVGGLSLPYPGIALIGTDVYVPLFGKSQQTNGSVAKISIATPSAPVVTAITQLASPQPGQFENPPSLTAANGYIYVAAGSESAPLNGPTGSSTIQVLNATTMQLAGTPFVLPHSPQQLTVSGNTLYATVLDNEILESIDISNPASLQQLQQFSLAPYNCSPLPGQLASNTAYVGCYYTNQILKIDATQPANLDTVSTLSNITNPQAMTVSGKYLLVVGSNQGGMLYEIDTTQAF